MQEERLRELWQAAGFDSLAELARRAGIREGTAQKHVERGSIPAKAAIAYISAARMTGADVNWLLTGSGRPPRIVNRPDTRATVDRTAGAMPQSPPAAFLRTAPVHEWNAVSQLPIFETRPAGASYYMLKDTVVDADPRPGYLSPQADVFAIYHQADDMEPRYERGDRLLISRHTPLVPGKDVLLLSAKDAEGRQRAVVRRLVAIRPDGYEVRSYNPPKVEVMPHTEWPLVHRVEAVRSR